MRSVTIPALLAALAVAVPAVAQRAHTTRTATRGGTHATASATTAGGDWRQIYSDDTVTVAVDPANTRRNTDGTYTARTRWQYTTDHAIGRNRSYRMMYERTLIDCGRRLRVKTVSARAFSASGAPVSGFDSTPREVRMTSWVSRPEGSASAKAFQAVCSSVRQRS